MAIIFASSATSSSIIHALTTPDLLVIPDGVVLNYTGLLSAVRLEAPNARVMHFGLLQSQNDGIRTTAASTASRIAIETGGMVLADDDGLQLEGSNGIVDNRGSIVGNFGIYVFGSGAQTITNHGLIHGEVRGIQFGSAGDHVTITNAATGRITQSPASNSAVIFANNDRDVTITNAGLIDGIITLNAGDDIFRNTGGTVTGAINLGDGNDTAVLGTTLDSINGEGGVDTIDLSGSNGVRLFLDGNGINTGVAADDVLSGFERVIGSRGADIIVAAATGSALDGAGGNDVLSGAAGVDELTGGAGNDSLSGGGGLDNLFGGLGNDTLGGGSSGDNLFGGDGNDLIAEQAGNDRLFGDAGADTLRAGGGADTLTGGTGIDVMTGGAGADRFVFFAAEGDRITDFGATDRLELERSGFGNLAPGPLAPGQFRSSPTNQAGDPDDRFIFRTTDTTLWFDANGTAAGGPVLVADLQPGATITAAQIFVFID